MNWWLIVFVGVVGAIADVVVSYWSSTHRLQWWLAGAVAYLIFMTGLGLIVRQGLTSGYSLTVAVVVVVLVNIVLVAAWDFSYGWVPLSLLQWFGLTLAIGAVACLELGRSS